MADYHGSTIPKELRDKHKTPWYVFDALDRRFRFGLDAAASAKSAKCANYITEEEDAHSIEDWRERIAPGTDAVFINPPFSDIGPWIDKARDQCQRFGLTVVLLLPGDYSVEWWKLDASEVWLLVGDANVAGKWETGRVQYIREDTNQPIKGNPQPAAVIIFDPLMLGMPMVTRYVSRLALARYADGKQELAT